MHSLIIFLWDRTASRLYSKFSSFTLLFWQISSYLAPKNNRRKSVLLISSQQIFDTKVLSYWNCFGERVFSIKIFFSFSFFFFFSIPHIPLYTSTPLVNFVHYVNCWVYEIWGLLGKVLQLFWETRSRSFLQNNKIPKSHNSVQKLWATKKKSFILSPHYESSGVGLNISGIPQLWEGSDEKCTQILIVELNCLPFSRDINARYVWGGLCLEDLNYICGRMCLMSKKDRNCIQLWTLNTAPW